MSKLNRKTLDSIFYDKLLDNSSNALDYNLNKVQKLGITDFDELVKLERQHVSIPNSDGRRNRANFGPTISFEQGEAIENLLRALKYDDELRASHPFLMGDATVESLLYEKPKTLDYIANGKVPFDNCFFNFMTPQKIETPFTDNNQFFGGFQLYMDGNGYYMGCHLATADGKPMSTSPLVVRVENPLNPRIGAGFMDKGLIVSNIYEPSSGKVWSQTVPFADDGNALLRKISHPDPGYGDSKVELNYSADYQTVGVNFDSVANLSNLAINIVNYINAHNVHVLTKDREVRVKENNENGKPKIHARKYPTSIVVVRDGEITPCDEPLAGGREIDYRYSVRGHDRKYRNPDNSIRLVSWVHPHIRGPEGAPFKDQYHAVFADKILAEKKLMDSYR